jgi:ABC-type multidrug transport system fused ATPase/permease subunit
MEEHLMMDVIHNIGWAIVFSVVGGLVGMMLVLLASVIVPRLIDRFTPNIDEQKEIIRGNSAVAEYYGRLVSAAILGVSIVVAAAVLGGVIAALH